MPGSNRNRYSKKNTDMENRAGNNTKEKTGYRKLPDNPSRKPDESISTAGNMANPKDSRTRKRKEDKEREQ
jgi:hypothetical protein